MQSSAHVPCHQWLQAVTDILTYNNKVVPMSHVSNGCKQTEPCNSSPMELDVYHHHHCIKDAKELPDNAYIDTNGVDHECQPNLAI